VHTFEIVVPEGLDKRQRLLARSLEAVCLEHAIATIILAGSRAG